MGSWVDNKMYITTGHWTVTLRTWIELCYVLGRTDDAESLNLLISAKVYITVKIQPKALLLLLQTVPSIENHLELSSSS